jgi:hypothetical protein
MDDEITIGTICIIVGGAEQRLGWLCTVTEPAGRYYVKSEHGNEFMFGFIVECPSDPVHKFCYKRSWLLPVKGPKVSEDTRKDKDVPVTV